MKKTQKKKNNEELEFTEEINQEFEDGKGSDEDE